jgi:DNA-binding CsgD family transcriptional regulator
MPDVITDAERAAIAAYKGNRDWSDVVTHIPRGVSGYADQPWNPGNWKVRHGIAKSRFFRERAFVALKAREVAPQVTPAMTTRQQQYAVMAARQAEVLKMVLEGVIYAEIAAKLGVHVCTVQADVAVMRKAGGFPSILECVRLRLQRAKS